MKLRYLFFLSLVVLPVFASANVVINEVAWMGTVVSANDEWIELYNNGSDGVDILGWRIAAADGQPDMLVDGKICTNTSIPAGGYFLLERTDDQTVPGVSADCMYTGALGNTGEHLQLFNANGAGSDSINAAGGWPAGDNTTKETMQKSGNGWITAPATPRAANASSGSGGNTGSNGSAQPSPSSSNENNSPSTDNSLYVPPEDLPRITTNAGKDRHVTVGEEVSFYGEARGLKDEPLENARYLWNFGDGETKEGHHVAHAYMFPGVYVVRVTGSSGTYAAFDDLRVVVNESSISISEVQPETDGWIEIENKSNNSVHVGGWIFKSLSHQFIAPSGTMIAGKNFTVLSHAATGLIFNSKGDHADLFYPNGLYAGGFSWVAQVPVGMSVSNSDGAAIVTEQTPGKQNVAPTATGEENSIPIVAAPKPIPQQPVSIPASPQRNRGDMQKDVSSPSGTAEPSKVVEDIDVGRDTHASVFEARPHSQKFRETIWFGGSLVTGGLLAVAVVFLRRRKYSIER